MNRTESLLFDIVKGSKDLTTTGIVEKSGLSKVTALKYLQRLRERGMIDYRMIGPSKVWESVEKPDDQTDLEGLKPKIFKILREFEALTGTKANIVFETDRIALTATLGTGEKTGSIRPSPFGQGEGC